MLKYKRYVHRATRCVKIMKMHYLDIKNALIL